MAVKMVKKPVEGLVEVSKNKAAPSVTKETVTVADVSNPTATVGFSASYTKNLGNYESLKITASLYMPVEVDPNQTYKNDETLNKTFLYVQSWVDAKLNAVLDELTAT